MSNANGVRKWGQCVRSGWPGFPPRGHVNQTLEAIDPLRPTIRASAPADDEQSPREAPRFWEQSTGTVWLDPEIDLENGCMLILDVS